MKLQLETSTIAYQIQSYTDNSIQLSGQCLTQSAIITPDQLVTEGLPITPEELTAQHLERIQQLIPSPKLVLLGTGRRIHYPPPAITALFLQARIGLEVMTTAAACRTYTVLAAEHRPVAFLVFFSRHE